MITLLLREPRTELFGENAKVVREDYVDDVTATIS